MKKEERYYLDSELELYVIWASKTYYGRRDSISGKYGVGPKIEPDEAESAAQIKSLFLMGVDITENFDTHTFFTEEELAKHIETVLKEKLTKETK